MSERSIVIVVNMTDLDIIERAAGVLGGSVYKLANRPTNRRRKQAWRAQIKGPLAAGWMMTIYSHLGVRRREQVRRSLTRWRAMRFVRTSVVVERGIVAAFHAGVRN